MLLGSLFLFAVGAENFDLLTFKAFLVQFSDKIQFDDNNSGVTSG